MAPSQNQPVHYDSTSTDETIPADYLTGTIFRIVSTETKHETINKPPVKGFSGFQKFLKKVPKRENY